MIFIVYTERVCKRWSTNDIPFHFTTGCCVSSQTEITHGNVAVLFSFSSIFTAIHELISYTRGTEAVCLYENTTAAWNAEWTNQPMSNIVILLISPTEKQLNSTSVTEKRENEFRLNVATATTRRRIYLEGIQIYTKHLHSVQPFPHTAYNSTTFLAQHGAPFTSVLYPTLTDVRKIPHYGTLPIRFAI